MSRRSRSRQKQLQAALITDPVQAAEVMGLQYVSDHQPGIQRQQRGKNFSYYDPQGKRITDPEEVQRINSLAIPPAYKEVWICPQPNGHIQATARDAKGRKQYRYHPLWRQIRDQTKFTRLLLFSEYLPKIRDRLEQDLAQSGLPKTKVLATIVRLMELTRIRVGNEEYARSNDSFGLTTLRDRHVDITGSQIKFCFRGKSGVEHDIRISDRRLARIVKRCQDLPGQELFQYLDDQGQIQSVSSEEVNAYLREITGQDFTAKDFRTWAGTVLAAIALTELGPATSETATKKNIVQAIKTVSAYLGNRPATCRKYYVHPAVLSAYTSANLHELMQGQEKGLKIPGLRPEEIAVVAILEQELQVIQG